MNSITSSHKAKSAPRRSTVSMWVNADKKGKRTEVVFDLVTLSKDELTSTVRVSEYNPRNQGYLSQTSLASLRKDIKDKGGIIEPAWAYSAGGYINLMDGSRRWRVAVMDGYEYKVWVTKSNLTADQINSITESFSQQKELSLIERGALYQKWLDDGLFEDKQSIGAAELKSATIITRALQAYNLRDSLKNCFTDPTTFGASLIYKLHKISKTMNDSDDLVSVMDFERDLVNEVDPELIEFELTQKLKHQKTKKSQRATVSTTAINTAITDKIIETFNNSALAEKKADEDNAFGVQSKGRLRMASEGDKTSLSIHFQNIHPSRQRYAADVNAAIVNSTVDVKAKNFNELDETAAKMLAALEEHADVDMFNSFDSVERKKMALLFKEIVAARYATVHEEEKKVTDIDDAHQKKVANAD
ncbi:ParB N-terminal domain-containing protein [Vibrio alginolyticus]|uniref:ParB N-terminal domain-containing protein n=1 Tax=Vibrio alginolyticus TaxID=663 RepID=UPI0022AAAA90|nr:ParB N-terminal domain-containing protein [Vibrio alginolyticus]MCZ2798940.1 ParB N-terminal domain-containing protein [Vibrio alginolyticus]